MTPGAIAAVAVFNVLLMALGTPMLVALRPAITRRELLRLAGVSYLLGVAAFVVVLTLLLVLGLPLGFVVIVLAAVAIFAAAGAVARRRRAPGRDARVRIVTLWSAPVVALLAVSLEAIFRKGRLQGLIEFDGWDSWGPKAKALYDFGRLDPSFLHPLPGGSYPPGVPILLASAMHAMGSADVVTVHLQYWFLGVGFVAALLGLLGERVTPLLLLPFVLLVFVMPDIRSRSVDMYGDLPLGYLVAAAALVLALWLDRRRPWQLPVAAILLAGAVLMKREGVPLAGCVVLAALIASLDRIRSDGPRLLGVFGVAVAALVPWQIWLSAKGLPRNGPEGGLGFLGDADRGWHSLRVVTRNLFDYDLRLVSATIALAAVGLCLLAKQLRVAAYLGSTLVTLVAGSALIVWSDPNISLQDVNVISRLVGTTSLALVAITPLALQRAFERPSEAARTTREAGLRSRALAWAMVAAAAVAYPATLLVEGGAKFPS